MGTPPRIKAETYHVDELVSRALRGRIRLPRFQRGLKWRDTDVQTLFDSIHRGFPIGTLLMWKRPADRERIAFGPVEIAAEPTEDAWWVVDGQQRLTSLVAGLRHPDPTDPSDPFVVYYDLKPSAGQPSFFRPHRLRRASPYCIPLARCFDPTDFQGWLFDFVQQTGEKALIDSASAVATRIRNYRVPVYVVETDDIDVAKQIFVRTNSAGRSMEAHEVFAALAPAGVGADRRPEAIAHRLSGVLGDVHPNVVMRAAHSLVGDDVTRRRARPAPVADHDRWMADTERALERALQFLRSCRIPHVRLLPAVQTPMIVLARFFHRHPEPSARSRRLLRRWLWRGFFAEALGSDARTLRRAVVAVSDDEDASVQALLAQVPKETDIRLPGRFDARNGMARVAVLVMALRGPVPPPDRASRAEHQVTLFHDGAAGPEPGDVFVWLREHGAAVFTRFPGVANRPAARFVTPGVGPVRWRNALEAWAREDPEHPALASHLVSPEAAEALLGGDLERFLSLRDDTLNAEARAVHDALGEPRQNDRPPLSTGGAP